MLIIYISNLFIFYVIYYIIIDSDGIFVVTSYRSVSHARTYKLLLILVYIIEL